MSSMVPTAIGLRLNQSHCRETTDDISEDAEVTALGANVRPRTQRAIQPSGVVAVSLARETNAVAIRHRIEKIG